MLVDPAVRYVYHAYYDPLVIDLDGDGIELLSGVAGEARFDVDGDGSLEQTGWVAPDDGLLVIDRDGNGQITRADELFSEAAHPEGGFAALAALDGNGDGRIDAADDAFAELRVWRDLDSDGVSDAGELQTLAEAGIASISLDATAGMDAIEANMQLASSTVTMADGTTRTIAELAFLYDPNGVREAEVTGDGTVITTDLGTSMIELSGADRSFSAGSFDIVVGTAGADTLDAGDGAILFGGAGHDELIGGTGNDELQGGSGTDALDGGAGNDILVVDAADLAAGRVTGGAGMDAVLVDDVVAVHMDGAVLEAENMVGGAGADTIVAAIDVASILEGEGGDDSLVGGNGDDTLIGALGNDTLTGGGGVDMAVYVGSMADYEVVRGASGEATVTDLNPAEFGDYGTDSLTGIERIVFADGVVHLDDTNAAPIARQDELRMTFGDRVLEIDGNDLLGNDGDRDGDPLAITGVADVTGGTAYVDDQGGVHFVAAAGFSGTASFAYTVDDGHGGLAVGRADVLVGQPGLADELSPWQWHLRAIDAVDVWADYTGAGVTIGIADDGVDHAHPDIAPNYDFANDWNYLSLGAEDDAMPWSDDDGHGTFVAGVAAGALDGHGIVGVAPGATVAGYQGYDQFLVDWTNMTTGPDPEVDILNNSWLPEADFSKTTGLFTNTEFMVLPGIQNLVEYGRGGLGTNIVFASGNDAEGGSRADYQLLSNYRETITVGSIAPDGEGSVFSSPGASVLISAPGSSMVSADRPGSAGYADATSTFGEDYYVGYGASASAPQVSGTIALMLEANPDLGWRDVQEILAYSAWHADRSDDGWRYNGAGNWNGGGLHTHDAMGFGYLDARAAVRLAETWTRQSTSANEASVTGQQSTDVAIADIGSVSSTISITQDLDVDHAMVELDIAHDDIGDLVITLTSPDGTVSTLVDQPGVTAASPEGNDATYLNFDFGSTEFRGETAVGDWTLTVTDLNSGSVGTLRDWTLSLYGDAPSQDDLYVYTDDFWRLSAPEHQERWTLSDTSGHDAINASMATLDAMISLEAGSTSEIGGGALRIADGTVIEDAYGGDGHDLITGNAADNLLHGGRGNDILRGGAGADTLLGGAGEDEILYYGSSDGVVVDLAAGTASGGDATGDVIDGVEHVLGSAYADSLTGNDVANTLTGMAGDDVLLGGAGDDMLIGATGADALDGGAGDDALLGGTGDDTIVGGLGMDTAFFAALFADYSVQFGADPGSATISGADEFDIVSDVEYLFFADHVVDLMGPNSVPTTAPDAWTVASGQTLRLTAADLLGNDTDGDGDVLDVAWVGDAEGGTVSFSEDGSITFTPAETATGNASFAYEVTDGRGMVVREHVAVTMAAAHGTVLLGTAGTDVLEGDGAANTLNGLWGVDYLYGGGGDDVLDGGAQGDRLYGGDGNDVYRFGRGSGADWIDDVSGVDTVTLATGIEAASTRVRMMVKYYDADGNRVDASTEGATRHHDMTLLFGNGDALMVHGQFDGAGPVIEAVTFADGTQWTPDMLLQAALVGDGTDQWLVGGGGADTIGGAGGADTLQGNAGDDVYLYEAGDGEDVLLNAPNNRPQDVDELRFGGSLSPADLSLAMDGQDLVISIGGAAPGSIIVEDYLGAGSLDVLRFADGTSWTQSAVHHQLFGGSASAEALDGTSHADVLFGGLGDDTLRASRGDDWYVIGSGDGDDFIFDYLGTDALILHGWSPGDVTLTRSTTDADDLFLGNGVTGQTITIDEQFAFAGKGLERFIFDDGTEWSPEDVHRFIIEQQQTSGADSVIGFYSADTLVGGLGDDTLRGGDGSDTYIHAVGDGNDVIFDDGYSADVDRLILSGISASDVSVTRPGADEDDVLLSFAGGGSVLLDELEGSYLYRGPEFIHMDDAVWSVADLRGVYLQQAATSGNDRILGSRDADTLGGAFGNDMLLGDKGSDTYTYAHGDGHDVVYDDGFSGDVDSLVITGIVSSEVTISRYRYDADDLVLAFDRGGSIRLDEQESSYTSRGIEQVSFDDVSWSRDQIRVEFLHQAATNGNDVIVAFRDGDTITGGLGNDTLKGEGGDDIYLYADGDGNDVVYDGGVSGDGDGIVVTGILSSEVSVSRGASDADDLVLSFARGGSIVLDEQEGSYSSRGVESVSFDDLTWTDADLRAKCLEQAATAGNDTIVGFAGDDLISGGAGADILTGAGGTDTFEFMVGDGSDRITDFLAGMNSLEVVRLSGFAGVLDFDDVMARASQVGADVSIDFGSGDVLVLESVALSSLKRDDFMIT